MDLRQANRAVASGGIGLLSVLAISQIAAPPMPGMWADVYTSHLIFWGCLIAVLVLLAIWSAWNPLPWWEICVIGGVTVTAMGVFAIQWGVPYPLQDPWSHLNFIQNRNLSGGNPYPAFHALILTFISITGLSAIHWLTVIGVLSAAIGTVGVGALLSRLPLSPRATQPAFFAALPAISQGFVGRPFMVAFATLLPTALLLFVSLLKHSSPSQHRTNLLLIVLWGVTPFWHPQLLWHITIIATATALVIWLSRSCAISFLPDIENASLLSRFSITAILVPWVIFITYITLVTPVGGRIAAATVVEYTTSGGVQETAAASQGTGVFSFLGSAAAAREALIRFAFPGLFLLAVGIAVLEQLWEWEFDGIFLSFTIAGGVMVGMFFLVFVFSSALGIERFVALVPLALFPAVAYTFKENRVARVGLVVCLLCTGVVGIYPSEFAGQAAGSATAATPAGMEWVANQGAGETIVGSGITRQLKAATQNETVWSRYDSILRERWPWTTNQSSMVVIQAADQAEMRQYVSESDNQTVREMYNNFTINCRKIYANGGLEICRV